MTLVLRLLALLGSIAHGIDRLVGRLLGFLPFRVPGALLVAVLFGVAAWNAFGETERAIAAQPRPVETSVSTFVAGDASAWVSVSGILSGPHLDNSIYATDRRDHYVRISDDPHDHVIEGGGEPILEPGQRQTIFRLSPGDGVTRWFYVLRDADGGGNALVVRSARDGTSIRARSVVALADGVVDGTPRLVEVYDAGADPATATVSRIADGERATIRGMFEAVTEVACDGGDACRHGRTWRYRVTDAADPDASAWVDSPHPPDALPVTLSGIVTADPTRMRVVLATDEMTDALDGLAHPDAVVLADDIGPLLPEVTYLAAALLGIVAALLLLSSMIPYPIFRGVPERDPLNLPRPVVDELIEVDVNGELPGISGTERPAGAPGRIGWLPARELARQAWHLRSTMPDAGDGGARLALVAVEGGFVLPVEPIRDELRVERGLVATSAKVRHGLRLTAPDLRLVLGFGSALDRDRVGRELQPGTGAPPVGNPPQPARPRGRILRSWARPATAMALAATALLVAVGGVLDLLSNGSAPVVGSVAILGSLGIGLLALGIARRHSLADELLPSAALLGLVVAGVATVALPGCGTWLTPNLADCAGLDAIALATSLTAVVTCVLSLWAMPHLSWTPEPG